MQIQELEMDKSEECTQEVALKFGDAATWWDLPTPIGSLGHFVDFNNPARSVHWIAWCNEPQGLHRFIAEHKAEQLRICTHLEGSMQVWRDVCFGDCNERCEAHLCRRRQDTPAADHLPASTPQLWPLQCVIWFDSCSRPYPVHYQQCCSETWGHPVWRHLECLPSSTISFPGEQISLTSKAISQSATS